MLSDAVRLRVRIPSQLTCAALSLLFAALSICAQDAPKSDEPEIISLELNKTVEREIEAGKKHSYRFDLEPDQYVHFQVRQISMNVRLSLNQPDGKKFWLIDLPVKSAEVAEQYVSSVKGTFVLDVFGSRMIPKGRYEIRIDQLRTANETERITQESRDLRLGAYRLHAEGKHEEARPLIRRSLEIEERLFGKDSPRITPTLDLLASNFFETAQFGDAEQCYARAAAIVEKAEGSESTRLARFLMQLGETYRQKGDLGKAVEFSQRSLAIYEKSPIRDEYMIGILMELLGDILYTAGDHTASENYFQRAGTIFERIFDAEHLHVAPAVTYLGLLAFDRGDYAQAEIGFQRALRINEKAFGSESIQAAHQIARLAMTSAAAGDYPKAEERYKKALAAFERGGTSHKAIPEILFDLAQVYWMQGRVTDTVKFEKRATELEDRIVDVNLNAGSDRQKLLFLEGLSFTTSRNVSLNIDLAPGDKAALDLAVLTVLRRKGRVQDALADSLAALHNRFGKEGRAVVDQFESTTSRLAKLILEGQGRKTDAEYQKQIKDLEDQRAKLEDDISRKGAGLYLESKNITLENVQSAIPDNTVLIEYFVYRPFNEKEPVDVKAFGDPRYVAYVIDRKDVRWADLGPAREINDAVLAMRHSLRDPKRSDFQSLARAVDRKVMEPLRRLTEGASNLIISPDSDLNLIPFEALVDEQKRYLVERQSISYMTSGRDLLQRKTDAPARGAPLLIADPDFEDSTQAEPRQSTGQRGEKRRSITSTRNLSETYFAPLTGTSKEARAILSLFPNASFLTGREATETKLKKAVAPSVLHIATHGFFLETNDPVFSSFQKRSGDASARNQVVNPMLRSGLALAGANRRVGDDDGIFTALEASALNLWGTKLVVLSACDTGLGEVRNGEGVYGLRRAFFLAGAESLVMSLWPVSDYVTRELMSGYYKNLKQGMGRGESLRRVQLEMLKRPNRRHPFYWASFIQSGEWASLDGKR